MSGFDMNPEMEPHIDNLRESIFPMFVDAGAEGLTCAEVLPHTSSYWGPVSGALSTMVTKGQLVMLKEQRRGNIPNHRGLYRVHVLPEHVGSREIARRSANV